MIGAIRVVSTDLHPTRLVDVMDLSGSTAFDLLDGYCDVAVGTSYYEHTMPSTGRSCVSIEVSEVVDAFVGTYDQSMVVGGRANLVLMWMDAICLIRGRLVVGVSRILDGVDVVDVVPWIRTSQVVRWTYDAIEVLS